MHASNAIAVPVALVVLTIVASCGTRPAATATTSPPATATTRAGAALPGVGETRESATFGYSWTLPATWQFMSATAWGDAAAATSMDVIGARTKDFDGRVLQVLVSDRLSAREPQQRDFENLERHAGLVLELAHARKVSSARVRMQGLEGVEVNGETAEKHLSIRAFDRGRHTLQFRCSYSRPQTEWPCSEALANFRLGELPKTPAEIDRPRVIHVREENVSLAFDAPDDSWLAVGPRLAGNGSQRVWSWRKGAQQIDLQLLDMARFPVQLNEEELSKLMANETRAGGSKVVLKNGTLSGRSCHHLEIDRPDGRKEDVFILFLGDTNYSLAVIQPKRNARFIETAKQGFRITWD
jgi:hypothetical protein